MSFASYEFLFQFLPLALAVVLVAEQINRERFLLPALIFVSAVFYGLGSIPHLMLLLSMIAGSWIVSWGYVNAQGAGLKRVLLTIGISINLLALTVWKYGNSLVETWNAIGFAQIESLSIIMPLGISFYAFQQIGYLLDLRRGKSDWLPPVNYLAFILFFPQLIAGPIVTEKRMKREFSKVTAGLPLDQRLELGILGLAWFSAGLFKKVVLADGLGRIVTPHIEAASLRTISAIDAWLIALAAPTRVYFDFCGYSDMAVGLALLFGIKIPANFNAPFRARTSRQFWARWHVTFHHFVRDHIYGPLIRATQNWRFGASLSLLLAVAISSLWHGNSVQFFLWGCLVWLSIVVTSGMFSFLPDRLRSGVMLTLTSAMFLTMGVLFTTPDLASAAHVLGLMISPHEWARGADLNSLKSMGIMILAMFYVRHEISTQVWFESGRDHRERHMFGWRPPQFAITLPWMAAVAALLIGSFHYIGASPPFVYFGI